MSGRWMIVLAAASGLATTLCACDASEPLASWNTLVVSAIANDEVRVPATETNEIRGVTLTDSTRATVDDCAQLGDDATVTLAGSPVSGNSLWRGGLGAASSGQIDFTPAPLRPRACGSAGGLLQTALGQALSDDAVVLTQGAESRRIEIAGFGKSMRLVPLFDLAARHSAGDTLSFTLGVPGALAIRGGSSLTALDGSEAQLAGVDVQSAAADDGSQIVSLVLPPDVHQSVTLAVSIGFQLPCTGIATCNADAFSNWSRDVQIR